MACCGSCDRLPGEKILHLFLDDNGESVADFLVGIFGGNDPVIQVFAQFKEVVEVEDTVMATSPSCHFIVFRCAVTGQVPINQDIDRGDAPVFFRNAVDVRRYGENVSARLDNPIPLFQRLDRVEVVFDDVGGDNES